jgi:hypothetical protein
MTTNPPGGPDRQWLLSLLPAFPIVLLVLRLWYLSRQDLPTMLLLVQNVSPLGLISALLISLIWVFPAFLLVTGALGALLRASTPDPGRTRFGRAALRTPDWVLALAALIAAATWQLRFLPTLLMLCLMIVGSRTGDQRYGVAVRRVWTLGVPIAVAALEYAWFGPAIASAVKTGEVITTLLLLVPPAATVALTGPIPETAAYQVTSRTAAIGVVLGPIVMGALFLRTPVLPTTALEVAGDQARVTVLRGFVIDVDDTTTTLLDQDGAVRFLANSDVRSKTLCPEAVRPPASETEAHGWPVEETVLAWVAPRRQPSTTDPRCQGRPLSTRDSASPDSANPGGG